MERFYFWYIDPGFCNIEFKKAPNLKAVLLSEWDIERINMATRSYKTPKCILVVI